MKRKLFILISITCLIMGLSSCSTESLVFNIIDENIHDVDKYQYEEDIENISVPHMETKTEEASEPLVSEAKLLAVGDIMFHMPQINSAKTENGFDFTPPFKYVKKYIEDADIAIANFETVTAGETLGFSGYPRFNSPKETILGLKSVGFDILSTVNNHSLDKNKEGIIGTINAIEEYGLKNIGTYKDSSRQVHIHEVNGIKIGFIAYTSSLNGLDSLLSKEEHFMLNRIDEQLILSDINRLKTERADIIVGFMHWGYEYFKEPTAYQVELGRKMVDWGVNIVLGSHPHIIQKSEIINKNGKDNLIVYSMGNFLSNQRYETMGNPYTEDGLMVEITLEKNLENNDISIKDINYIPTWIHRYKAENRIQYDILPIEEVIENGGIDNNLPTQIISRLEKSLMDTMTTLNGQSN